MSKQFFGIQFEDYSLPEGLPMPKTYYGTLHQIKAVMDYGGQVCLYHSGFRGVYGRIFGRNP